MESGWKQENDKILWIQQKRDSRGAPTYLLDVYIYGKVNEKGAPHTPLMESFRVSVYWLFP